MTLDRRQFGLATMAATLASTFPRLAFADDGDVAIGFTGPLSGGAALYGRNCLAGLQMAVAEINAGGGLDIAGKKVKFSIVALDDRYSPSEAALNAKRLVQQNKASVVFCPHSGGIFAIQAFNQQEDFLLAGYSSVPKITQSGNTLTLRIPPAFDAYIEPFVQYEMKHFGKRLAMAGGDHEYAKIWAKMFGPAWEKAGGTIVGSNPMSYNKDADFYSGVSKVLADKPDVMFVGGASQPTALVVKQARELGFQGGFAIMDQAKLDEMAVILGGLKPLDGSIGVLPLAYDDRPAAQSFVKRYKANHPEAPNFEAAFNYTAVYVVTGAMALAGTTSDAKAIRAKAEAAAKGLSAEHNPDVVSGIGETGGFVTAVAVGTVEDGKVVQVPISAPAP